jgi:hypothetical protein
MAAQEIISLLTGDEKNDVALPTPVFVDYPVTPPTFIMAARIFLYG